MLKRTLLFSNPYHLSVKNAQLVTDDKNTKEIKTVPIEDIGFILFEHPQITFTQMVMQLLAENNTAVIFCNNRFMPSSMLLHLETNQVQAALFRNQIGAGAALKNSLWQQTVQAKLSNQAGLLKKMERPYRDLELFVGTVKSGDKGNMEAWAARLYWPRLMGDDFHRGREGGPPNALLNYGYAILRAAVARSLSGSGLLPTFGIHHRNQYNAFALADDIMEPYRPFVDEIVLEIINDFDEWDELNKEIKSRILQVLTVDVTFKKTKRPLMVGLSQTSSSLARCFTKEIRKIDYPRLL
ncbi:MAG: type II CRISPR-associated endonuclease Cas1 [Calditrichaceae bacterium]|nr:type II CRISPR-associated endonuclease Cas1 [Calditrichaceae bacterium]MBN2709757.1 type II CRISPR-associated endonuclease Cas1 [Calditrichaceae bacterium]RQV94951.1 MAG: type II CRISPR-associated endonuclease Cas1 [Calditrichota bacterium]